MTQGFLFEPYREPLAEPLVEPCDPNVLEEDKRRLSDQCQAILEALQAGPRTNRELADLAIKYTSRVSDLRAAGYDIPEPTRLRRGLTLYRLGGRGDSHSEAVR